MQRGVELRRAASAQVWAVIQKKHFLNLEEDPPSTTGHYDWTVCVRNRLLVLFRRRKKPQKCTYCVFIVNKWHHDCFCFLFALLWTVLIQPLKRNATSKPSRTSTVTTQTSVWRFGTACVTGTWQCSGGCITTSTPTPPSSPTHSGGWNRLGLF